MDQSIIDKYQPVIGLEVHAQLSTLSKIFASDSAEFGSMPNTNVSVITLGHPGTLPKLNKRVVEYAIKMGLACGSEINRLTFFDRKNYFYPDLPKGFQTTQDRAPICIGGSIKIKLKNTDQQTIRLNRIHMEDDAGKNMHLAGEVDTLVDYNRAGVPLIEIVTEPDIRTSEEAYAVMSEIRKLVRYLEICDGNMEEGSMRCDANVSVMLKGAKEYGKKVEVKNMNSVRNVQRAIDFEILRQIELIEKGEQIVSESRQFDAEDGTTHGMRTKEELNDYRYFPEPDLQPVAVSDAWLAEIKAALPALPQELYAKFSNEFKLSEYDVNVLTDSKEIALYFNEVCNHTKNYKAASNWVTGAVKSHLNELALHIKDLKVYPEQIALLVDLIDSGKVNTTIASQSIFPELLKGTSKSPQQIAEEMNLIQQSNTDELIPLIQEIIAKYPAKVAEYKGGKTGILSMFMGDLMKATKGKADPKVATELIKQVLEA
ncbi:Asp-tRNA(Asn)/Glu-tRNA(Gln) amidotransferase subunit GatB [Cytophaga hutchinsonii]|uniref:Aspartyl/glutamyl-tRNA(Asn/Gln) amidotransferase subunit B n=1 Tax=Cytophaga hutchinsonii (strain ATCC 33406 / DSM 1761 / CIP 103989 / NBRC 15051 / NCIMB 9469 / D465) TaxID=269798 RepID=A0A6N4SQW3_CYTH3|nr:Asp-tRNA(Asn)/Glu-tRNA(Gln) amidotransferase subunit GatB [Cytophaga hutchinsonii]ABG58718.1 aspartyl/glutamyl-tRNA(Asn/Gln) amidotransferase subunit B [Cytophaga hutchinsonii ATCC 33406]SFX60306.1 aspartyl/glutamyl-tRNA(Asn/Gln) amidotransferase subunit B [Cytophaga hutchinsonii ATCC 33406]